MPGGTKTGEMIAYYTTLTSDFGNSSAVTSRSFAAPADISGYYVEVTQFVQTTSTAVINLLGRHNCKVNGTATNSANAVFSSLSTLKLF